MLYWAEASNNPMPTWQCHHLGSMHSSALDPAAWRELGTVRENVFLCLEAQVAGLGFYTVQVCQIITLSSLVAHLGCVDSACMKTRGKAVSPSMLLLPISLFTCEFGPLGPCIGTGK